MNISKIIKWIKYKDLKRTESHETNCFNCGKEFEEDEYTWYVLLKPKSHKYLCDCCGEKFYRKLVEQERSGKKEKEFEVWSSWNHVTGNESEAIYLGTFKARDFNEACDKWADTLDEDSKKCYVPAVYNNRPYYCTCLLYDNQEDANEAYNGVIKNTKEKKILRKLKDYIESTDEISREKILEILNGQRKE